MLAASSIRDRDADGAPKTRRVASKNGMLMLEVGLAALVAEKSSIALAVDTASAMIGTEGKTVASQEGLTLEQQIQGLLTQDWSQFDYPTRRKMCKTQCIMEMSESDARELITKAGVGLGKIQRDVLEEIIMGFRRSKVLYIDPSREDSYAKIRKYMLDVLIKERYALMATLRRAKYEIMTEVAARIEKTERAKYTSQEIQAYLDKEALDAEAAKWQRAEDERLRELRYGGEMPTGIWYVFAVVRAIWRSIVAKKQNASLE